MTEDLAAAQERAARVAGAADLLDVRLLSSHSDLVHLAAPDGPLSFSLETQQKVEHDEGQDFFAVRVKFELKIEGSQEEASDDSDVPVVATIEFEYGALYSLVELNDYEPSVEEFQAYAETAATLTLYPYAREFINSMTNRFGLPKLVLPTHRLPSPWHPDSELATS